MINESAATIANCPRCQVSLGLPAEIPAESLFACPACGREFELSEIIARPLPTALVVARAVSAAPAAPAECVSPAAATVAISPDTTVQLPEFPVANDLAPASEPEFEFAVQDEDEAEGIGDAAESYDHAPALDGHATLDFGFRPVARVTRRRPGMRSLLGVVAGGIAGVLLAGYALVWLRGPEVDVFRMADWLPAAMLPSADSELEAASLSSIPPQSGDDPDEQQLGNADAPAGEIVDSEVTPASAVELTDELPESPSPELEDAPWSAPNATIWPATPVVSGLGQVKFSTLADLAESTAAAEQAGSQFLAGNLGRRETVRDMGRAYVNMCAVAERYTLINPSAYGPELFTQQALAKAIFSAPIGSAEHRRDLAVIAARWLQHDGRPNQGALFIGRVREIRVQGPWTEYVMELGAGDGDPNEVLVLMDKVRFTTGSEAAVAGVIVADPQMSIADYQGDARQVIVAGYVADPSAVGVQGDITTAPEFEHLGH